MPHYAPFTSHTAQKPLTYTEAVFSMIKALLGTGILNMPANFKHSGWLVGILCTAFIAALVLYAAIAVIGGTYQISKRDDIPLISYKKAVQLSLKEGPKCCRYISTRCGYVEPADSSTLCLTRAYYVGNCSAYTVFLGYSLEQIVHYFITTNKFDSRYYILIMGIPLLALMMIRYLKYLAPLAMIAMFMMAVAIILCFRYILLGLPLLTTVPTYDNVEAFPLFYGGVLFTMPGLGVMIAIQSKMKYPEDFFGPVGVLSISMCSMIFLYDFFGLTGFWRYGEETKDSITLNLPQHEVLSLAIKILFMVGIFSSYSLHAYVPANIIRSYLIKVMSDDNLILGEYLVRMAIVIVTLISAISMPKLGIIISLVGSLGSGCLCLILPGIMSGCIHYSKGSKYYKLLLVLDIFIVVLGVVGVAVGTVYSAKFLRSFYRGVSIDYENLFYLDVV